MSSQRLTPGIFDRYLRILGVSRREPSHDALAELVASHLMRIPFENVSKLYYRERARPGVLPSLEQYLDGIERYNFGGTCYPNNYHLHLLLVHLGYEVMLCGADMTNPDAHLVNIVTAEGREFLVDVGYAAPFLEPLPRDLDQDYVVALGRDRYLLKPKDKEGASRLELYRDAKLKHAYTARPIPRGIEHFAGVIEHSYSDEATFMNAMLLVRFGRDYAIAIHNLSVIESAGTRSHIQHLNSRDELPRVVEEYFRIPSGIVAEAVAKLERFEDAWH